VYHAVNKDAWETLREIKACLGDISTFQADALVNAANNHLWMGSGVAGALKRNGGSEIEEAAVKQGPVKIGEAVVTGAGHLKAKYVIHAAVMGRDLSTDAGKIKIATLNSLRRAEELGIKSIAFPAMGTGVGGFPLAECARIMVSAVREFVSTRTGLEKVSFVLYNGEAFQAFRDALPK
jgi:O-acetyl-ADP-ribose deacetylase (regulator of RNase III)